MTTRGLPGSLLADPARRGAAAVPARTPAPATPRNARRVSCPSSNSAASSTPHPVRRARRETACARRSAAPAPEGPHVRTAAPPLARSVPGQTLTRGHTAGKARAAARWPLRQGAPGLYQIAVHEGVGELGRDGLPGGQHPVIDGSDKLIGREVHVLALAQFAAASRAQERLPVALALRRDELGLEPGRDLRVVLRLPRERAADDARVGSGQERGDLAEVVTEVAAEVSVVGRGEMLSRVSEQRIEQDGGLRSPPAIDSLFGDPGPGRDALDRHPREAALDQQVVGCLEHGYPGRLAPAVPVAVVARRGVHGGRILASGSCLDATLRLECTA